MARLTRAARRRSKCGEPRSSDAARMPCGRRPATAYSRPRVAGSSPTVTDTQVGLGAARRCAGRSRWCTFAPPPTVRAAGSTTWRPARSTRRRTGRLVARPRFSTPTIQPSPSGPPPGTHRSPPASTVDGVLPAPRSRARPTSSPGALPIPPRSTYSTDGDRHARAERRPSAGAAVAQPRGRQGSRARANGAGAAAGAVQRARDEETVGAAVRVVERHAARRSTRTPHLPPATTGVVGLHQVALRVERDARRRHALDDLDAAAASHRRVVRRPDHPEADLQRPSGGTRRAGRRSRRPPLPEARSVAGPGTSAGADPATGRRRATTSSLTRTDARRRRSTARRDRAQRAGHGGVEGDSALDIPAAWPW